METTNYNNTWSKNIETQESKDRFVASECLKWLCREGTNLQIAATEIQESVDLRCSIINNHNIRVPFNVEIKERYKSAEKLNSSPYAELKVDKYNRMRAATPEGTVLLYMVLLNQKTCLLYNLDKLDWSKVQTRNWRIKRTQMNPNSDYITVPTFFIPYSEATVCMDCSIFFQQYVLNFNYYTNVLQ